MTAISVIVPVFNTETYLKHCLDSLYHQTFKDIEVIVVNDGSPGDCGGVILPFTRKIPKLKYIEHPENKSLMQARLTGLRAATGAYVLHLDSDDWLAHDTLEPVLNAAKAANADITHFPVKIIKQFGEVAPYLYPPVLSRLKQPDILSLFFKRVLKWTMFNKLFHHRLSGIITDDPRYENIYCNLAEDLALCLPLFYSATTYVGTPKGKYYYFQNEQSLSRVGLGSHAEFEKGVASLGAAYELCRDYIMHKQNGRFLELFEGMIMPSFDFHFGRLRRVPEKYHAALVPKLFRLYEPSLLTARLSAEYGSFLKLYHENTY